MKIMNTSSVDAQGTSLKLVIAGEAGNGKTTLAKTLEQGLGEKVLVISAEAGLLSIQDTGIDYVELQQRYDDEKKAWIQVPKAERITRLIEIYKWLQMPEQTERYRWIFIDSLTEISQAMLDAIEIQEEFQGAKNTIRKYGELSSRMMSMCKTFRDMTSYSVVFSALVKNETDQDNITKLKISLIGAFADRLPALFDEVLYLGVTKDVDDRGRNIRMLLTQKTEKVDFPKDRSGKLDRFEPADLSVIVKKIRRQPIVSDISHAAKERHAEHKAVTLGKNEH